MALKSFDPTKCITTVATVPVSGWADGDMIVVSYTTNATSTHVGTGGEYRFIDSKDLSGTITIRLADYSPLNTVFDNIVKSGLQVPISVVDKTTQAPGIPGDTFFTPAAKNQKIPDMMKGNEAKMNEWIWEFGKGVMTRAGSAEQPTV
jgi:hypothetical protein